MSLRILITNLKLSSRTGTEIVTRDLALALRRAGHAPTVYTPRPGPIAEELRAAGVQAALQVFEGQSHAHYIRDDRTPETKEAFEEIAAFFDAHWGK